MNLYKIGKSENINVFRNNTHQLSNLNKTIHIIQFDVTGYS